MNRGWPTILCIVLSVLCLEWTANPHADHVFGYKIYELHAPSAELLAEVDPDTGEVQYFIPSTYMYGTHHYTDDSVELVEHVPQLPDGFEEGAKVDHCFEIEHESVLRYGFYIIGYDNAGRRSGPSNVVYCDQECIDHFAKKPSKTTGLGLEDSDGRGR